MYEIAHNSDSNLYYYQSMITIIVAILLIHVFGRKSKSYPGVQYDVSHLCVYSQLDVGHCWQIISLPRAFTSYAWVQDNISFITGNPNDITVSFREYIIIYSICV